MDTYYLKFTDEAEAIAQLADYRTTQTVYEERPTGEVQAFNVWQTPSAEVRYPAVVTPEYIANKIGCGFDEVVFLRVEQETVTSSVEVGTVGIWQIASHTHALDVVGTIYKPTGRMIPSGDPDMPAVPEMAALDGFHVNLMIAELPDALLPFVVTPSSPSRVFA